MSISNESLSKIDTQTKGLNVKKGSLNMAFVKDDGDINPPKVNPNIENENSSNQLNIPDTLKTVFGMINMVISATATHQDVIVWTPFNEAELTQLSQTGASVPQFQNLANGLGDSSFMFYGTLLVLLASHCKVSENFKNRKKKDKQINDSLKLTKEEVDILKQGMKDNVVIPESLMTPKNVIEPIYDGIPEDNSEPLKIIDEPLSQYEQTLSPSELNTRKLLMSESEMSIPEIQARTKESKLIGIKRRQAEIKTEMNNSGVKKIDY